MPGFGGHAWAWLFKCASLAIMLWTFCGRAGTHAALNGLVLFAFPFIFVPAWRFSSQPVFFSKWKRSRQRYLSTALDPYIWRMNGKEQGRLWAPCMTPSFLPFYCMAKRLMRSMHINWLPGVLLDRIIFRRGSAFSGISFDLHNSIKLLEERGS